MKNLSGSLESAAVAELARRDVALALAEDVGAGDLTAGLIAAGKTASAKIIAREEAVLCGAPWVSAAFTALDPQVQLIWHVQEGQRCQPNQTVLEMQGDARALLTGERTALNFLQLLSAVATKTALYVAAIAGTGAQIVDTRKTLPGLRLAQKYAVRTGGGANHRIGLYDAILIKENHIAAAGGIPQVLAQAAAFQDVASFIQIEVETLDQLRLALQHGAAMVLLDNMDLPTLHQAVVINRELGATRAAGPAILEISGGVKLEGLRTLADTGVDRISIGALTKDVTATDFSMRFAALQAAV
jgi:nicotinate-nucleotide pyrophosphorylase (carboxylating)